MNYSAVIYRVRALFCLIRIDLLLDETDVDEFFIITLKYVVLCSKKHQFKCIAVIWVLLVGLQSSLVIEECFMFFGGFFSLDTFTVLASIQQQCPKSSLAKIWEALVKVGWC